MVSGFQYTLSDPTDSPDSHLALCDWLGVHPCGCELGECRCSVQDDDGEEA